VILKYLICPPSIFTSQVKSNDLADAGTLCLFALIFITQYKYRIIAQTDTTHSRPPHHDTPRWCQQTSWTTTPIQQCAKWNVVIVFATRWLSLSSVISLCWIFVHDRYKALNEVLKCLEYNLKCYTFEMHRYHISAVCVLLYRVVTE